MNKKHWLTIITENIASIIALVFLVNTFFIFYLVLLHQVKTSDSTTITIIQLISNILMLIVGFYFGASKKSNDASVAASEAEIKYWSSAISKATTTEELEIIRNKIPPTLTAEFEKCMNSLKSKQ